MEGRYQSAKSDRMREAFSSWSLAYKTIQNQKNDKELFGELDISNLRKSIRCIYNSFLYIQSLIKYVLYAYR